MEKTNEQKNLHLARRAVKTIKRQATIETADHKFLFAIIERAVLDLILKKEQKGASKFLCSDNVYFSYLSLNVEYVQEILATAMNNRINE